MFKKRGVDQEFEAKLGYIARLSKKQKKKTTKRRRRRRKRRRRKE
jgi:hypothetical protein